MSIREDEIDVTTDEDVIEEEVTQEEETVEQSEVSDESDPAIIQDEEEEDRIVSIGDLPAEDSEGAEEGENKPETPGWVKTVRKVNRKLESENKRLKRELEAKETETVKPVALGEKPTLASVKYDDAKYEAELEAYWIRKRQIEGQAAEKAKTVEEQNNAYTVRKERYANMKQEHSFKDFTDIEELVSETFSPTQYGIIIQGAEDSALVVYALGKNPKKLEELSKISNPIDFAFQVSKVEAQLKVSSRKAPKPESRVNANKTGGISGNTDKVLERLRADALKSGDSTKVVAYKRKLRNKDK